MWLKTLYRKRAVTWPFIFYTIIWTLSNKSGAKTNKINTIESKLETINLKMITNAITAINTIDAIDDLSLVCSLFFSFFSFLFASFTSSSNFDISSL
ncbi:hypothetical protein CYQ79_13305 [Enterococcus faecium]|nr:hypothetical protein CYQ79_13305 [Enterococcus faecium]